MAKFRAPLETTVISTRLTVAELRTLETDFATHQSNDANFVIRCNDQLEASTLDINETWEANQTQCSSAPATKTKTGLEAMATLSIGDDRRKLFQLATNGAGVTPANRTIADVAYTSGSQCSNFY